MTKLKTLKDLKWTHKDFAEVLKEGDVVNDKLLVKVCNHKMRKEAIKWIHKIRNTTPNDEKSSDWKLVEWIKQFFNITEHELK